MIEKYIKDLSPELQEKARKCRSISELLELVGLTPEAVAAKILARLQTISR